MRVKFLPIKPATSQYIENELYHFNLSYLLFLAPFNHEKKPGIEYIQSYSDHCRYNLHLSKGTLHYLDEDKSKSGNFCFIEIETLFDLPFDFILYRYDYVNYWGKDCEIDVIKPYISIINNKERHLAIAAFRSLATSFFYKITEKIGEKNNINIIKNGRKIMVAFKLNKINELMIDYVIENFINAIYEMVKATEFYGYYEIKETDYKTRVNMADQYHLTKQRNFLKRRKIKIES